MQTSTWGSATRARSKAASRRNMRTPSTCSRGGSAGGTSSTSTGRNSLRSACVSSSCEGRSHRACICRHTLYTGTVLSKSTTTGCIPFDELISSAPQSRAYAAMMTSGNLQGLAQSRRPENKKASNDWVQKSTTGARRRTTSAHTKLTTGVPAKHTTSSHKKAQTLAAQKRTTSSHAKSMAGGHAKCTTGSQTKS